MMEKFRTGQPVKVCAKNKVIEGVIKCVNINPCTFETQYDVDYQKDGKGWTMIGVPETSITPLNR